MSHRNFDKLKKSFQSQNADKEDLSQDNVPLPKAVMKSQEKRKSLSKKKERINYALFNHENDDDLGMKNLYLKLKNGRRTSFPYDYKPFIDFNPDMGSITLSSSLIVIVIEGLRLEKLFDYLAEHQVDWLKESEGEDTGNAETHISQILIRKNHD